MDASHHQAGEKPARALSGTLVARVRDHDELAARELVERLYPLVAQVVRANLPRRDEPEDLMQEIFMKMFSRLEQFRGTVPFEHWVARIALTTCLDQLRRQRARPELRFADLTDDQRTVVERVTTGSEPTDADAPQALALFNRLLDGLAPADAWLLRAVELEQKPLTKVCAVTGWNGGAARVRLFRARRRLQAGFRQMKKGRA
jgi:RNA polymerase sigma-70 factor (ECF subfamily)